MTSQQLLLGINTAEIVKKLKGSFTSVSDQLAIEEPLQFFWRHGPDGVTQPLSMTMRTPGNDLALLAGHLFTEGIISNKEDVIALDQTCPNKVTATLHKDIDISRIRDKNFMTSSSCGVCGKTSIEDIFQKNSDDINKDLTTISQSYLNGLLDQLEQAQSLFSLTGGIHAAALFDQTGTLISLQEDVGRHNALDKLIGNQLINGNQSLSGHTVLLSGRASFELIQKAATADIPIIIAVGAPSSAAVQTAQNNGQTLLGFFKGDQFNIYCNEYRIQD